MLSLLFLIFGGTFAILWSITLLPLSFFGIKLYKITGNKLTKFLKNIKHSSILNNGEPDGWIIGYPFVGYIFTSKGEYQETKELCIFTSTNFYNKFIEVKENHSNDTNDNDNGNGKNNNITYWEREGTYWHLHYSSRDIVATPNILYENQKNAINKIIKNYKKKNNCIALLYGKSGCGKSMTAQYLCNEMLKDEDYSNISLVDSFDPFEYGDNFSNLYNRINPTKTSPLVIVLEEIDIQLLNVHYEKIEKHKTFTVMIKNKTDWNTFFDKFDRKLYPHVIIIMTTNKSASFFDELDVSYMRKGRVDKKIEFL